MSGTIERTKMKKKRFNVNVARCADSGCPFYTESSSVQYSDCRLPEYWTDKIEKKIHRRRIWTNNHLYKCPLLLYGIDLVIQREKE